MHRPFDGGTRAPWWCLVALAVLVGCGGPSAGATGSGPDAQPVTVAEPVAVDAASTLRLTGTVTAERRARLSAQVSGLVQEMHADAGDAVSKGEVLVDLDATTARLEVARTEASLERERSRHAEAEHLVSASRAAGEGVAERTLGARIAEAEALAASVKALEAELALARERLARHRVRAPFDGVVTARMAEQGEWIDPGMAVFELVAVDAVRLDLQAPQEYLGVLGPDTPVQVRPSARRDAASLPGRVSATVPVTDASTRTFLVRVVVDDPAALEPGTSAEATFRLPAGVEAGVGVPRDAIVRYPDGSTSVWVVVGDGNEAPVEERQVRVRRSLADTVEVAGLEPGVRVVVRGNERLRAGDRVQVTGAEGP